MSLTRRAWLGQVPLCVVAAFMCRGVHARPLGSAPLLSLPRDHGAHLPWEMEWWALKGEIAQLGAPPLGFHISFWRMQITSAMHSRSNFAPRHVLAARASITDSIQGVVQEQCAARMGFGVTDAPENDLALKLRDWTLTRGGTSAQSNFEAKVSARSIGMTLRAEQTQPPMLHGANGRLDPQDDASPMASRYYSIPSMNLTGEVRTREKTQSISGHAWFDHGWCRAALIEEAAGVDWFGLHMYDGSMLMLMRMRKPGGTPYLQVATMRRRGQPDMVFGHSDIKLSPLALWRSPSTGADYPVAWQLDLGGRTYIVKARIKSQEMDGGSGIGDVVWEGLCDVQDVAGQQLGVGILEMSGYAQVVSQK